MTYAHIFERDPHLKSQNDYNPKLWLVQRLYGTTVFFENNENALYIDLKLKAKQAPASLQACITRVYQQGENGQTQLSASPERLSAPGALCLSICMKERMCLK